MPNIIQPHQFARIMYGLAAARPISAAPGTLYYATDDLQCSWWTGSIWSSFRPEWARSWKGVIASIPTPTYEGFLYYAIDEDLLYVVHGGAWVVVNPADARTGYYEDTNNLTVFDHEFAVAGGSWCQYQLMGFAMEENVNVNKLQIQINQSAVADYDFVRVTNSVIQPVNSQTAWCICIIPASDRVSFDYTISQSYAVGHIVGMAAAEALSAGTLLKGQKPTIAGLTHIRVFTENLATGRVWLRKLSW